jgi:hypothetical protein
MNLPASWWWPLVLACLSVLDGGFAGYRDAAGRDGRVFKDQFYRRAVRRGLRHGLAVTALVGLVVVALVATSQDPVARLTSLLVPARVLGLVLGGYASVVLLALAVWMVAEADLRTLASVTVLGPFTLLRPPVMVVAAALGLWDAPDLVSQGVTLLACLLQLGVEGWLGRGWRGGRRPLDGPA